MPRGARSLITLRDQINKKFPYRDKASDGGLGDPAHAARVSDHNPDGNGIWHAYDFDHDPDSNGLNCVTLKAQLVSSGDRRIKYIIFQRQIWYPGRGNQAYTGVNAHTQHLHLSVNSSNGDDPAAWALPMLDGYTTRVPVLTGAVTGALPLLYVKEPLMSSPLILKLQQFLVRVFPRYAKFAPTGNYGELTETAIKDFQRASGLLADGKIGSQTWAALVKSGFRA